MILHKFANELFVFKIETNYCHNTLYTKLPISQFQQSNEIFRKFSQITSTTFFPQLIIYPSKEFVY
jgi:hypothetical protein